jgi:hypothetical protein
MIRTTLSRLWRIFQPSRTANGCERACRDCRWVFVPPTTDRAMAMKCFHPRIAFNDSISGDLIGMPCRVIRISSNCGPRGKLWEPRPPRPADGARPPAPAKR